MNLRLVAKLLGVVSLLIGGTMIFSLPWASPALGRRTHLGEKFAANYQLGEYGFEHSGFWALLASITVCAAVGLLLLRIGRKADTQLFRKEAMAVVGLSWVLATVLGALPFYISGTCRSLSVRVFGPEEQPQVLRHAQDVLPEPVYPVINALVDAGAFGLTPEQLIEISGDPSASESLRELADTHNAWRQVLVFPGEEKWPHDRIEHFRIRPVRMTIADTLFESQSGFSTTGATVIADLDDPMLVPHCLLFWRSSTHFLGGLGIIVLFVVILGQGSAGKALMRAEMPGPSKEGSHTRMQHTAWLFTAIYCALNGIETIILKLMGLTWFDAICHAFGTMATGGFSTYNASVGQFNSAAIDTVLIIFMLLAGTNFTLLYLLCIFKPKALLADVEWRTYMGIIFGVTALVMVFGIYYGDFADTPDQPWYEQLGPSFRYGLFQVISIVTTTGYGTHDFDSWNSFGRGVLFLLMFVGGCAGSTGGGMKVIRHVLFLKILRLEMEHSFHPSVVRPLRIGGQPVDDPDLRKNILVYFGLILVLFVFSWMFLVTVEPDATWGTSVEHKLIDSATAIAATINNIGPGLGTIGATQNYANFSSVSKLLFTWLMMIGRLEIYVILVLFIPAFWRIR